MILKRSPKKRKRNDYVKKSKRNGYEMKGKRNNYEKEKSKLL